VQNRHVQLLDHKFVTHVMIHGVNNHSLGMHITDRAETRNAFTVKQIGDVIGSDGVKPT
jgi:hypothetical protein